MNRLFPCLLICLSSCARSYHSQEGGFSVAFAAEPKEQRVPAPHGQQATILVAGKDGLTFAVSWFAVPKTIGETSDKLDGLLDEAIASGVANLRGTVKDERAITLDGHKGKEVLIESERGGLRGRFFIANGRLYQVFVAGQSSLLSSREADGFLDSLKVE
jgi:hypothetical protein